MMSTISKKCDDGQVGRRMGVPIPKLQEGVFDPPRGKQGLPGPQSEFVNPEVTNLVQGLFLDKLTKFFLFDVEDTIQKQGLKAPFPMEDAGEDGLKNLDQMIFSENP